MYHNIHKQRGTATKPVFGYFQMSRSAKGSYLDARDVPRIHLHSVQMYANGLKDLIFAPNSIEPNYLYEILRSFMMTFVYSESSPLSSSSTPFYVPLISSQNEGGWITAHHATQLQVGRPISHTFVNSKHHDKLEVIRSTGFLMMISFLFSKVELNIEISQ